MTALAVVAGLARDAGDHMGRGAFVRANSVRGALGWHGLAHL